MDDPNDAQFDIVPVDPHRFLALWSFTPELFQRAEDAVGIPHLEASWFLRVFRLDASDHELHQAHSVEDFSIVMAGRQSFFALRSPGGVIVAVIGVKDRHGRFSPLISAPRVALPEAPEIRRPAPVRELDEERVLKAAGVDLLPEELRLPPEPEAIPHGDLADSAPGLPDTLALNEHKVIATALAGMDSAAESRSTNAGGEDFEHHGDRGGANPTNAGSLSSARLASHFDEVETGAPITLQGRVVVEGIVLPGQRILIDGIDVESRIDGRFTWKRPLTDFTLLWSLLSEIQSGYSAEPPKESPVSHLLLRALIDIEGIVRDPWYRSLLPGGISPDASGRIRLIREIAPETPFIPRIEALPSLD